MDWSSATTFRDRNCAQASPPALFGCGPGNDGRPLGARGDFGSAVAFEAGIGFRFLPFLRAEALLGYRTGAEFSGDSNFLNTPEPQPVSASLDTVTAMFAGYVELAGLGLALGPVEPFLGAGIGIAHHDIGPVRYAFPGLSASATTVIQGGETTSFAAMLTAGVGMRLSERVTLDLAYRYLDLGQVASGAGPATITRTSGTRVLDIAGTKADLTSHGVALGLRFHF